MAIFASKMSTTAGYRQRGDPHTISKDVYVHSDVTAARHGYNVTETPERLFSVENRHSKFNNTFTINPADIFRLY